jgi:hypothetical protein
VSRLATAIGLAVAGAGALVYERARRIAEAEGRPLTEVLADVPSRLVADLRTVGDDLREAAEEGREAAARMEQEIDEELRVAREASAGADV